jgi:hypothetical protein
MTPAGKVERRKLTFTSLDEVVVDAEKLLGNGYEKAGNWELAQVCLHLADWLRFPIDGFPKPPLPIGMMLWALRKTIGKKMYRKYMVEGMPAGKPTMPQTVHRTGLDPTIAVGKLREAVEQFKGFDGTLHPSPLFGSLTKDEATRLQLAHCAHHLSFLVPKT